MCYRPSWIAGPNDQVNQGTCPSCGMPVAASIGITAGDCPHCGEPITAETVKPIDASAFSNEPKKIL